MNNTQRTNLTLSERMGALRQGVIRAQQSRQPEALKRKRVADLVATANTQGMFNWQLARALGTTSKDLYGDRTVLLASLGHFGPDAQDAQANTSALYWLANGGVQYAMGLALVLEAQRQAEEQAYRAEMARQDRQLDYTAWLVGAKGQKQWGRFATNAAIRHASIHADSEWYSTVAPVALDKAQRYINSGR